MPLWLEQFVIEHGWVLWMPLALCAAGAAGVWAWQSQGWRPRIGGQPGGPTGQRLAGRRPIRVGWFGGLATTAAAVAALAVAGDRLGLWSDVWAFVNEQPALVAWWVAAIGGAVMLWGMAVHAWRGEVRLARQCRRCGYDMSGVPGMMTCPECGRVAINERQLRPRNVRRGAMWVGGLLVLTALTIPTILTVSKRGPVSALPGRTLVWWLSKTSSPPQQVVDELNLRLGSGAGPLLPEVAANADQLAARWLEGDLKSAELYRSLLSQREIPVARQLQAVGALADPSVAKRSCAVQLLGAASNPIELSAETVSRVQYDPSPQVSVYAGWLLDAQVTAAIAALTDAERKGRQLDLESARRYLRVATTGPVPPRVPVARVFQAYLSHPDKEVALRATCLIGIHQRDEIHPDMEAFAGMMRAKARLDESPLGPGPAWGSLGWHCQGTTDWKFFLPLIHHQDSTVRLLAFKQLLPSASIPAGTAWAPLMRAWRALLDDLQSQVEKENDGDGRAALARLITEIQTERPSPPAK